MAVVVRMPKLGLSMVEGTVTEWHVADGDAVAAGDVIVAVETSKINYEVEAPAAGTVRRVLAAAQDVLPVGAALCVLGEPTEEIDFDEVTRNAEVPAAALPGGFDPTTTKLGASGSFGGPGVAPPGATVPAPEPVTAGEPAVAPEPVSPNGSDRRIKATPVARKLAASLGVDLATVHGHGPGGRIEKRDVEQARPRGTSTQPAPASAPPAPAPVRELGAVPLATEIMRRPPDRRPLAGTMRRAIAANMHRSKQVAAHATMSVRAEVSELVALRDELNGSAADAGEHITYTDLFLKAVARCLVDNPMMRTVIDGEDLVTLNDIDISVAVHLGEVGLIVPVIRDCDRRGLRDISRERARLIEQGRAGRLTPDDMVGGCFTLTNMGAVYDLDFGTPIINLPQSAILGIGSVRPEPVALDGAVVVRPLVHLFLSIDHRVIDGEPAVRFLNQVSEVLSQPGRGFALH